jgi:transcriptional regulator with XRE-family HTH domain
MKTTNLRLGELIRLAREDAGLTQPELAAEIGMSTRSIQEWENGRINATRHTHLIEDAIGKPRGWFNARLQPLENIYSGIEEIVRELEKLRKEVRQLRKSLDEK